MCTCVCARAHGENRVPTKKAITPKHHRLTRPPRNIYPLIHGGMQQLVMVLGFYWLLMWEDRCKYVFLSTVGLFTLRHPGRHAPTSRQGSLETIIRYTIRVKMRSFSSGLNTLSRPLADHHVVHLVLERSSCLNPYAAESTPF